MTDQPVEKIEVRIKAISDIVHSINNSLFIASGKIEMLLDSTLDEEIRAELEAVYAHLDKIKALAQDLQALYKKQE